MSSEEPFSGMASPKKRTDAVLNIQAKEIILVEITRRVNERAWMFVQKDLEGFPPAGIENETISEVPGI